MGWGTNRLCSKAMNGRLLGFISSASWRCDGVRRRRRRGGGSGAEWGGSNAVVAVALLIWSPPLPGSVCARRGAGRAERDEM